MFLRLYATSLQRMLNLQCIVWLCLLINKAQLEICLDIYEAQETLYLHS